MIGPLIVFAVFVFLAVEGVYFLVVELRRARRETAYWDARASRAEQYDWAKELEL